ncbi:capsular biosynthesis protein, partial [Escherichia coli]|nr:capsular biosynthesis protein [Escherichia coli]
YLLVKTQVNGVYYGEMIFNKIKLDKDFRNFSHQVGNTKANNTE